MNSPSRSGQKSPTRRRRSHRSKSPLSRIEECIDNMTPIDDGTNNHSIEIISNYPPLHTQQQDYQHHYLHSSRASRTQQAMATTSSSSTEHHSEYVLEFESPPSTFCADPKHLHSFQQLSTISSMFKSKFMTCQICNQRSSSIYYGDTSKSTLLQCLACGIYVHKTCLLAVKHKSNILNDSSYCDSSDTGISSTFSSSTSSICLRVCSKNQELLQQRLKYMTRYGQGINNTNDYSTNGNIQITTDHNHTTSNNLTSSKEDVHINSSNPKQCEEEEDDNQEHLNTSKSTRSEDEDRIKNKESGQIIQIYDDDDDDDDNYVYQYDNNENDIVVDESTDDDQYKWSDNGPPTQHWALASPDILRGIKSNNSNRSLITANSDSFSQEEGTEAGGTVMNLGQQQSDFKTTFSNLSKALTENLLINLHVVKEQRDNGEDGERNIDKNTETDIECSKSGDSLGGDDDGGSCNSAHHSPKNHNNDGTNDLAKFDNQTLLQEATPKEVPTITSQVTTAVEVVKNVKTTRKSMGIASVAGTVAGGVVGLAVAGPAGAYLGSRIGQIAAGVSILIGGSVRVGILVAGVKGTMFTVNQLQNTRGGKNRVLTLGEAESECKVVLVRPHIVVDPEWEKITLEARKSAPSEINHDRAFGGLNFLSSNDNNHDAIAKKGRKERDVLIASSDDHEISKNEKIFLLVSSSLNDKSSLPGFVYRNLVEEIVQRSIKRKSEVESIGIDEEYEESRSRLVRQDVHAVIKYVTATLLEVRPGFGASERITEMSASAVESLIFGEVYDLVYAEITDETRERDKALEQKIQNAAIDPSSAEFVSEQAIESLQTLSAQHSVYEKLHCCVSMLEAIANESNNQNVNTDNLLKMVCQHIVLANVNQMNAECVFLEDFARDEQLLRGKEGYALVTLQASLHFLNICSDLNTDVFGDD